MNERECETCIKRKSIYCPNSNKCFNTSDKPYYQNRIMLLEEKQELITFLKEEQDRLARECSPIYEDGLGKHRLVNEDIYNEVSKILSKIEKR